MVASYFIPDRTEQGWKEHSLFLTQMSKLLPWPCKPWFTAPPPTGEIMRSIARITEHGDDRYLLCFAPPRVVAEAIVYQVNYTIKPGWTVEYVTISTWEEHHGVVSLHVRLFTKEI